MFHFNRKKVIFSEILGEGSFGKVHPYRKNPEDKKWVVKTMYAKNTQLFFDMIHEVVIGFSCNHSSILPLRGYHIEENKVDNISRGFNFYLKLPRMSKSLRQILKESQEHNQPICETDIVKCFHTIASGLEHLHSRRIAHRDIKPGNILSDGKGSLKIADVGCALLTAEEGDTTVLDKNSKFGTTLYLSPEGRNNWKTLKKNDYLMCDMWSLGAVVYEMCSSKRIGEYDSEADIHKHLIPLEEKYNPILVALIADLLCFNARERMSAKLVKEILEENFKYLTQRNEDSYTIEICRDHLSSKIQAEIGLEMVWTKRIIRLIES